MSHACWPAHSPFAPARSSALCPLPRYAQALAALPLLEELCLAGCCHLGAGALVAATTPPSEAAALEGAQAAHRQRAARRRRPAAGEEDAEERPPRVLLESLQEEMRFPTQGAALPMVRAGWGGTAAARWLAPLLALPWPGLRACPALF